MTLRYDKRASGPHVKEAMAKLTGKISMEGHRQELAGAVRLLASQPSVDPARLFVLTNSEGCIHALNYQRHASDHPFAGLVLTAPPARAIGDLARSQIAAQLVPVPGGDKLLAAYDAAMADFAAGRPVTVDDDLPEMLRMVIGGVTTPANQPFSRELWTLDPAKLLAQITDPVLVVIGKKDLQVDWQVDGPILEGLAQRRANISIVYPPNANHVLKYEPKSRAELSGAEVGIRYNADDATLDPDVLDAIRSWLADHAQEGQG